MATQARREECHCRRLCRRASKCHAVHQLVAGISGKGMNKTYEEKEAHLLEAEDGLSTTMADELSQLSNAADISTSF
jgi:hypothetical protein